MLLTKGELVNFVNTAIPVSVPSCGNQTVGTENSVQDDDLSTGFGISTAIFYASLGAIPEQAAPTTTYVKPQAPQAPVPQLPVPQGEGSAPEKSIPKDKSANATNQDPNNPGSEPPKKRKNGQRKWINNKTGELTLVGMYPPIENPPGVYRCSNPECIRDNMCGPYVDLNGYKVHLTSRCPSNPDSKYYEMLKEGKQPRPRVITADSPVCADCGKAFSTVAGYGRHRNKNETTRFGACIERKARWEQRSRLKAAAS
jgi:hypothetical protein